jgi:CubicO group peptidase (beta-lactamase class C family)
MWASRKGLLPRVVELIAWSSDINAQDEDGWAARCGGGGGKGVEARAGRVSRSASGRVAGTLLVGGHFGGGLFINAYDMARFGLLTLRKGNWNGQQIISEDWIKKSTTPTSANTGYGFMNYFLNTDKKMYPSAPATAYAHIGNGTNAIYVDRENDIVAVIKWMDDKSIDGFLKLVLTALPK